ncbi:MAG: hypothetical protein CTY35_13755 [Methylotenera sp.]|nr:MAG: hypothetical protein CTY35_13755 [Methylotenera sp.]
MSRAKTPELLNISEQQLEDISLRIDTNSLSAEDIKLLRTLLTTYTWLMKQLSRSKITIHRLKQLFGYSSEKKNRLKNSNPDVPPESGATEQTVATVPLAITATEGIGAEIEPIEPSSKLGVLPENK